MVSFIIIAVANKILWRGGGIRPPPQLYGALKSPVLIGLSLSIYIMILSSTSPYALLKEFSIACGFKYDAVFRVCLNNFCERLSENIYYVNF